MHFHNVCPDFAPLSVFAAGTWHSNASLPAVTTISPSRRVNSDCYVNCTGLKQKKTSMPCCIQVQHNYDKQGRFKEFLSHCLSKSCHPMVTDVDVLLLLLSSFSYISSLMKMLSLTSFLGCTTSGILINEELIITRANMRVSFAIRK